MFDAQTALVSGLLVASAAFLIRRVGWSSPEGAAGCGTGCDHCPKTASAVDPPPEGFVPLETLRLSGERRE
jgi:hypothetical protein